MSDEKRAVTPGTAGRLTVDELARRVGMSARNIRAHQARRLLSPPLRSGRAAYYDESHVRRLETIHELQQQGYNLVAIATILGAHERAPGTDELAAKLDRLLAQQPRLVHALSRHGIVARGNDGRLRTVRPRAVHAALALSQAGIQPGPSLLLLSETLDRVMLIADELVGAVGVRALTSAAGSGQQKDEQQDDAGHTQTVLTERLVILLTEAFRVAVENRGQAWIPAASARQADGDLRPRPAQTADFG